MAELTIGYARVSTDEQDLTAQRDALLAIGIQPDRIYVDHGLTGSDRNRPGLREALAACRAGDTFAVTKLDRLARSVLDAHQIANELAERRGRTQHRRLDTRSHRPDGEVAVQRPCDDC